MKLESVSIAGFRSIRHLTELELGAPTILSGHNDAGKSAIIDAILMLLGQYKPAHDDLTYEIGEVSEDGAVARVPSVSVEGQFALSEDEAAEFGATTLRLRRVSIGGDSPTLEVLRTAPTEKLLRDYGDFTIPLLRQRFTDLGMPHESLKSKTALLERLDEVAAAAPQSEVWTKAPTALDKALPVAERFDAAGPFDAEEAIRSTLQTAYRQHLAGDDLSGSVRDIEQAIENKLVEDVAQIRDHIMEKVGDIGQVDIQPSVSFGSANGLKSTSITVTSPAGENVDLHRSGAGRARRITLAVWEHKSLLLRESGQDVVLLYDEPDTHLDYAHQRELIALIHEQASHPNVTVVVASHSMNMIDGVDISNVVHIKHEEHRTVVDRLADDTQVGGHLGAIAASVGLRNTVLLHERLFVGVEGASEAQALPVLFKLATGRQLESCGIALWPCHNNEGALRFAEFLSNHGRQVAFLVDRDSKTGAKHIFRDSKLQSFGLDPGTHCLYVGDPNEIEDVFTDAQWAATANNIWPRDADGQESNVWVEADFTAHRSSKFSGGILEMVQVGSTAGPQGKPAMLAGLALDLTDRDQVPEELREIFDQLIQRAL